MREELIGYLCNALEPHEREQVERRLAVDPQLQNDLVVLRRGFVPLETPPADVEPPRNLAERTCDFVWNHGKVAISPRFTHPFRDEPPAATPRRWSLADLSVGAGIAIAACAIILPAITQSRTMARLTACGDNLRELGVALTQYSSMHHGTFPDVPTQGPEAAAGIYAPKLRDVGLLSDPRRVICPASTLADQAEALNGFRVPSLEEIHAAHGDALTRLQAQMGGSYGYSLGYMSGQGSKPTTNLQRSNFAIMADAPRQHATRRLSVNHGEPGQNVLFEDGHVRYMTTSKAGGRDDIFLNDNGQVALGLHRSDAVIAPSGAKPLPTELGPVRAPGALPIGLPK